MHQKTIVVSLMVLSSLASVSAFGADVKGMIISRTGETLIAEEANCVETAYLRLHFSQRGGAKGTTNGFLRRRSGLLLGKQLMEQENSSR